MEPPSRTWSTEGCFANEPKKSPVMTSITGLLKHIAETGNRRRQLPHPDNEITEQVLQREQQERRARRQQELPEQEHLLQEPCCS